MSSSQSPFQPTTRRHVLKGSLTLAVGYLAGCARPGQSTGTPGEARASGESLIGFKPVPRSAGFGDMPVVSEDYEFQVLIPWGEPLDPEGPAFDYPPSAGDQARQIGIGHDGMKFFATSTDGNRGLLAINHEYGKNPHVLGKSKPGNAQEVLASQHAHGISVVEIANIDGRWQRVAGPNNRRIHGNTPMDMSGPVAGSPWIQNNAANPLLGTLNNCASGFTPWGTYLTCEENFNHYFGATGAFSETELTRRYEFSRRGEGYGWEAFDPRFDLSHPDYANEVNRFGWVVEIDPQDPDSTPVKRSALGRFKHEGATVVEGAGSRIVVYLGDDQRFEFIYKFVSEGDWREMVKAGRSPLDHGVLWVARFDEDGTGVWLPLTMEHPALADRFTDEAEMLVHARVAATLVGATPMDRPEWISVAPGGDVYCTLTNNTKRVEPNAANPTAPNLNGHIIRWHDDDAHTGSRFTWDIFLLADDHYKTEDSFGSPDGLWADPDGRLFICTDGDQFGGMHNQLLVADTGTGEISRLLTGVPGCEITGITATPDRTTLFVNIQHPGRGNPARTNFPALPDGKTVPRDATLAIRRKDGGVVGS